MLLLYIHLQKTTMTFLKGGECWQCIYIYPEASYRSYIWRQVVYSMEKIISGRFLALSFLKEQELYRCSIKDIIFSFKNWTINCVGFKLTHIQKRHCIKWRYFQWIKWRQTKYRTECTEETSAPDVSCPIWSREQHLNCHCCGSTSCITELVLYLKRMSVSYFNLKYS